MRISITRLRFPPCLARFREVEPGPPLCLRGTTSQTLDDRRDAHQSGSISAASSFHCPNVPGSRGNVFSGGLVRAPVVAVAPVRDQLLHVGEVRAVRPAEFAISSGKLVRAERSHRSASTASGTAMRKCETCMRGFDVALGRRRNTASRIEPGLNCRRASCPSSSPRSGVPTSRSPPARTRRRRET